MKQITFTAFERQSLINGLSNPINRNRLVAKISKVMSSSEDAISKLADIVTVADVDNEERVVNSLVEILMLKIVQDMEAEVWSRFQS